MKLSTVSIVASIFFLPCFSSALPHGEEDGENRGLRRNKNKFRTNDIDDEEEENPRKNPFKGGRAQSKLEVEGGKLRKAASADSGKNPSTMKGVKRLSEKDLATSDELPATGLFLLDTDYLPNDLQDQLDEMGMELLDDGTLLDEDGEPATLIVKSETYEVEKDEDDEDGDDRRRKLASPFPFAYYTWNMYWKYRGGYCRDYRAWTNAAAWGPLYGGYRPNTNIAYIETRAAVGSSGDRDWCYNCDYESSYDRWDIGCFWPAHGTGWGWHYARWMDGGFNAVRSWSWSH